MRQFSHLPLNKWRWLAPVPACCVLQCLFGLLYAFGVYVALIDDPVFTLAIGIAGVCTSLGITMFGILMNRCIPPSHSCHAPRYVALLGALGLAAQLGIARAVAIRNGPLLFISCIAFGLGLGALYVSSLDVLQAWVPEAPGMVTGLGMLCGGSGSLLALYILRVLSNLLNGPVPTLTIVAPISAAAAFAAAVFTTRPPSDWHPISNPTPYQLGSSHLSQVDVENFSPNSLTNQPNSPSETDKLLSSNNTNIRSLKTHITQPPLSVLDILRDPAFYTLLVAFAATVGPGFGFILAFQRMAHDMFGVSVDHANRLFFWVTLVGVIGRLISGVTVDFLSGEGDQAAMQGARQTNMLLLLAQTAAIIVMPLCVKRGYLILFTMTTAVVYLTFSGGAVVAACMARVVFTPKNASLTFSLVGVSIGLGDVFFSWIVALCGKFANLQSETHHYGLQHHVNDYNLFFLASLIWSIVGIIATAMIDVSDKVRAIEGETIPRFPTARQHGPGVMSHSIDIDT